ncbi:MAG: response regulator [Leptolyngbyaceae cyanobacterium]
MAESDLSRLILSTPVSIPSLIRTIQDCIQSQSSSTLYLKTKSGECWWLTFYEGQLLWASGGNHRFRRWQRLLRQTCPNVLPTQTRLRETNLFEHWEYFALSILLQRQQIDHAEATTIIQTELLEVSFDIFQAVDSLHQILQTTHTLSPLTQPVSSSSLFYQAGTNLKAWQATGLGYASPDLAPVVIDTLRLQKSTQPRTYQVLRQLFQGKHSLRELATIMGHDLTVLGRMLEGYVRSETVALKPIADLSAPCAESDQQTTLQEEKDLPLVFCIDESPQVGYLMVETLQIAGYRCISLQDSVQALVQIIRHKPHLIFLSATMPIANGYEICKQIRRAKAFCNTPIVILLDTGSFMERAQAKAAGATTSIVKPINPSKVMDVVERELDESGIRSQC